MIIVSGWSSPRNGISSFFAQGGLAGSNGQADGFEILSVRLLDLYNHAEGWWTYGAAMNQTERIVLNCAACGTQVPIVAEVCPKCGNRTRRDRPAQTVNVGSPAQANDVAGPSGGGFAAICGSLFMTAGLLMLLAAVTDLFRPGTFVSGSRAVVAGGVLLGLMLTAAGSILRKRNSKSKPLL